MSNDKSVTTHLEQSSHTRWLLGLVLALAVFVAALEYTSSEGYESLDDLLLDEIPEDMEFVPAPDDDRQLEALRPQTTTPAETLVEVADAPTETTTEAAPPPLPPISLEVDPSIDDVLLTEEPVEVGQQDEVLPTRIVEQLPQFPGGTQLFMKWLTKNLKYPENARRQNIQGLVMVSFIVNADGTTSDARVIKSVEASLDREALRVIRMMPRWEAGIYKGSPCRTLVHLPIVFKI